MEAEDLTGKAILLQEELSIYFHEKQHTQDMDSASFQEKVSKMISSMNSDLSMPDEKRDNLLALKTKNLLKNSAVKSQLAMYLALQSQLERLSTIVSMINAVDKQLASPEMLAGMKPNDLILLQKSLHQQFTDITNFVENQKLEGLDTLLTTIIPSEYKEMNDATNEMKSISSNSRDRVQFLIQKMIERIKGRNLLYLHQLVLCF